MAYPGRADYHSGLPFPKLLGHHANPFFLYRQIVAVMQPDAAKVRFVAQENAKAMTIACSFMSCCVGWLVAPCLYTTLKSSHIGGCLDA